MRPAWMPLSSEAKLRGLSTQGLRRWCCARGVPIRQSSLRDAWVSPGAIDAAVEALPLATVPEAEREGLQEDVAEALGIGAPPAANDVAKSRRAKR